MSGFKFNLSNLPTTDSGPVDARDYYTTTATDGSGLVSVDISHLNASEILSVTVTPVGVVLGNITTAITTVSLTLIAASVKTLSTVMVPVSSGVSVMVHVVYRRGGA